MQRSVSLSAACSRHWVPTESYEPDRSFGSPPTYPNGPDKGNISQPCAFFRDERGRPAAAKIFGARDSLASLAIKCERPTISVSECIDRHTVSTHCLARRAGFVCRIQTCKLTTSQSVDAEHSAASNTERSG